MAKLPWKPDYAVSPGLTLQETIDSQGLDQAELALRSGLSAQHIRQIMDGVAPITHDTATRLERATGVPARMWNNLESLYQEQQASLADQV